MERVLGRLRKRDSSCGLYSQKVLARGLPVCLFTLLYSLCFKEWCWSQAGSSTEEMLPLPDSLSILVNGGGERRQMSKQQHQTSGVRSGMNGGALGRGRGSGDGELSM